MFPYLCTEGPALSMPRQEGPCAKCARWTPEWAQGESWRSAHPHRREGMHGAAREGRPLLAANPSAQSPHVTDSHLPPSLHQPVPALRNLPTESPRFLPTCSSHLLRAAVCRCASSSEMLSGVLRAVDSRESSRDLQSQDPCHPQPGASAVLCLILSAREQNPNTQPASQACSGLGEEHRGTHQPGAWGGTISPVPAVGPSAWCLPVVRIQ